MDNHIDPLTGDELRHHTFDGIQEFDKRLPNWWLFTLYAAMAFSFFYWFWLHSYPSPITPHNAAEQLELEKRALAAEAAKNPAAKLSDEQIWNMSRDGAVVAQGKAIFMQNCVTCHGAELQGGIGPALRDEKRVWYHGRGPTQVLHTITEGVAAKGMPTWKNSFSRVQIASLAAFVLSHHTTAANPATEPAPGSGPSAAPATPPAK